MSVARPQAAALEAWQSLSSTHALVWRELEDELSRECSISLVDHEVLTNLIGAPGHRLRLQELVCPGRMTKSGVSRLVDRLEAAHLIRMESCPSDRRGAFAVLTDEGLAIQQRAAAIHLRGLEERIGNRLDPEQMTLLCGLLEEVRQGAPPDRACGG